MRLVEINAAPAEELDPALLACCDVPAWAAAVREGRPYDDVHALVSRGDEAFRRLGSVDVERALAAHPRIGERAEGNRTEAAWSRQEQAGVAPDALLVAGNDAYEERFGRVFLICATGLSGEEILDALHRRLDNDEATEALVVADELRKIAVLRLRKL
ncbi:MAG TPA: 2-oxo-4-hydroxy-4-carboxy-5-ureidoimidazoline decarboxylase, partial [Marmoricola sp.]|nr:2-oxo-4-hydroxy-4-carboxy-5-ureidoimidazoline decarboxylase [Marmoricola sp.]